MSKSVTQTFLGEVMPLKQDGLEIQLPKIEIPKFSDNVLEWTAFWDLYSELVRKETRRSRATNANHSSILNAPELPFRFTIS